MIGTKRIIKYKKERVVISDILPYEIPLTFSNRNLYDFITKYKIEISDEKIGWKKENPFTGEVIKLLFGIKKEKPITDKKINIGDPSSIPFNYKISHKESDFRQLTIIHPKNQLAIVSFYDKYKESIIYYCSLSEFSIRRASKVSKFRYFKDKTHRFNLASGEYDGVEEYDKEYENLKTFFVYKNYSNIHKFYESYKYHRCEKKYNKLLKFDITKCFDSIYTHSISWALMNKDIVKAKLLESKKTFGGEFDLLMQKLNYNETNGIVIGPEFSRIFAELILQRIDKDLQAKLKSKKLFHKSDYEVFRYVDDYFVFYNDTTTKDVLLQECKLLLKEYKLSTNDSKTILYEKPLITEITIAKQKISSLLNKTLTYNIEEPDKESADLKINITVGRSGDIYVSSNKLITKFKTIIKETGVEYKDILNFTLAVVERKIFKILKSHHSLEKKKNSERNLAKAILEILDFTFFLYAVSPRVNSTIKLCRILRRLTDFLNEKKNINLDFRHLIFKKIYDNIFFVLHKNKSAEHTQVETLYLLIILSELGKEYRLDSETLCSYLGIGKDNEGKEYISTTLNYFSITVLLFYIRQKTRYTGIKKCLKFYILQRFRNFPKDSLRSDTENIMLLFDLIVCPYLEHSFKIELLELFDVDNPTVQNGIINERKFWFTQWSDFNLGKELDAKQSQEVY